MHPRARDTPVHTVYIHRLFHTSGIHTVNHLSVAYAFIRMGHRYGHLLCSFTVGAYNEGVFKGYLYVRHLSVTGMTGMTRNMKSTGEYQTAQKFTEKLSFLSLLS